MQLYTKLDETMPKSVPLSVRISDDDAAFLARFATPGASTPSEKLRAILETARRRHEGEHDFDNALQFVEDIVRPSAHRLRTAQRRLGLRSDFVGKLYEHLPHMLADLVANAPTADDQSVEFQQFEAALADQFFALMEEVLDLGLTSQPRTYDPQLIRQKSEPIIEIVALLKQTRSELEDEADE